MSEPPGGGDLRLLADMSLLVTGAGGFIGAAVVRALVARGAAVRALLGPPGVPATQPPSGVVAARAEIDDCAELEDLATGADAVVHLAGSPSVAASFATPAECARVHVVGTAAVLEACRRRSVARVVHVSSAEVYGNATVTPVSETAALRPCSPYAAAKVGAESLVEAFARAYGVTAMILRPFSVYGPGASAHSLLATILRQARVGGPIVLRDLRPARDYCFVDDVVDAILRTCIAMPPASPRAYNVGSGSGTTAGELARRALAVLGYQASVQVAASRHDERPSDIFHLVSDPSRAARELGWRALTSLDEGLTRCILGMAAGEAGWATAS